ncbi:MAG: cytochrome C oxidase subunit IV family protein [Rubrivivax sp.]
MDDTRSLDRVWLGLLAATAVTTALGEAGLVRGAAAWPLLVVFGLSFVKGLYIALDFMELRGAPPLWRRFVLVWLALVVAAILAARWAAGG